MTSTFIFPYLFVFQDHAVLSFLMLEKQGRPGCVRGYLSVQKFSEDASLCPVAALVAYSNKV